MFRLLLALAILVVATAFSPMRMGNAGSRMQLSMANKNFAKIMGTAIMASSLIGMPLMPAANAAEGAGAKISIFGNGGQSSPFAEGVRDDTYSPYSPYGDGSKAVYKDATKGNADEVKFWKDVFAKGVARTEKIPGYTAKKTWTEITTELTRYDYNLREAMNRLATVATNPKAADKAAKTYFEDLSDVFVYAKMKDAAKVTAAYEKSLKDLATYKTLLK